MRTLTNNKPWEARKVWALYRRVRGLLLSPKEEWSSMKWKLYARMQRAEKRASSWEEELSSLPEDEWVVAESQRGMTLDEVKIVWGGATPWKTGIFLRGKVELFTGGWVSCCWVPKRNDAENEKSNYKTEQGGLNKKEIQLNLCNIFSIFIFNELYLFT